MRAGSRERALRWAAACLAAAALAAGLASCGEDSSQATAKAGALASKWETGPSAPLPAKTKAKLRAATFGDPCAGQIGGLLDAMNGLRRQLVAGLAYEQYVGAVKKLVGAYNQLPADEIALGCLRAAGTPTEKALNRYIAAGNVWTDCVEVQSCEAASIEADLQTRWHRASEYLSEAEQGLRSLG